MSREQPEVRCARYLCTRPLLANRGFEAEWLTLTDLYLSSHPARAGASDPHRCLALTAQGPGQAAAGRLTLTARIGYGGVVPPKRP